MHVVYAMQGNGIDRADTAGCNGCGWRENESYTLNTIDRPAVCYEGQNCLADDKTAYTLQTGRPDNHHIPSVVYDCRGNGDGKTAANLTGDHENRVTDYTNCVCMASGQTHAEIGENVAPTLTDDKDRFPTVYKDRADRKRKYIVRRLTPLECCRLQGFPDWWMDGVEGSDSAKYKMWGNGMALPNMLHVMRGIARCEDDGER